MNLPQKEILLHMFCQLYKATEREGERVSARWMGT